METALQISELPSKKIGRPTTYDPSYCDDIVEFFSRPTTRQVNKTYTTKAGTVIEEPIEKPCEFPTLEEYAAKLGTTTKTLWDWAQRDSAFGNAVLRAKELQKDCLVKNGISGRYDSRFAQFVAVNFTDLRMQPLEIRATIEHEVSEQDRIVLESIRDALTGSINPMIDITPSK